MEIISLDKKNTVKQLAKKNFVHQVGRKRDREGGKSETGKNADVLKRKHQTHAFLCFIIYLTLFFWLLACTQKTNAIRPKFHERSMPGNVNNRSKSDLPDTAVSSLSPQTKILNVLGQFYLNKVYFTSNHPNGFALDDTK